MGSGVPTYTKSAKISEPLSGGAGLLKRVIWSNDGSMRYGAHVIFTSRTAGLEPTPPSLKTPSILAELN